MLRVLAAELAGDRASSRGGRRRALRFPGAAAGRQAAHGRRKSAVSDRQQLVLAVVDAGRTGTVARAVVMVQREMAKRVAAPPGSHIYGRLTVAVAQHAEARILFDVEPGSFHPAPAVTSSVMSLRARARAARARP